MKMIESTRFVSKLAWLFRMVFVLMVVAGGLPIDHRTKVYISLVGGLILGFLMAIRFSELNSASMSEVKKMNANEAEARELIKRSMERLYQSFHAERIQERNYSTLQNFNVQDTIKSAISILLCFGMAAVLWFEPLLLEFNFFIIEIPLVMAKAIALQFLYVLLISTGFAGIFLNLFGKFKGEMK